jgi:RNA polymerase sigma factor (sigma-70 family)
VLQGAYCRILAGDASFAGKSEFSTWVFGVIRHVALEEFRKEQRQRKLFHRNAQIADRDRVATTTDPVSMEQRERAEQLGSALETLSNRQREVLHLTFYDNMTIEQAAKILGISIGSARQHYHRGKESLRHILSTNRERKP